MILHLIVVGFLAPAFQEPAKPEAPPQEHLIRKIGTTRFSHSETIVAARLSPDGKLLATGDPKTLKVWDFESGKLLHQLAGFGRCVAFSRDGRRLAVAGPFDVRLIDAVTGDLVGDLKGHVKPVLAMAFSPDGTRLATASDDVTARGWDVESSKELFRIEDHLNTVFDIAYAPDGRSIATASRDGTVGVWSADDGSLIRRLAGHGDDVRGLVYGAAIVTGGGDDTKIGGDDDCSIRTWEAATGAAGKVMQGHRKAVQAVALSNDGATLATGSVDGEVRFWQWPAGTLRKSVRAGAPVRSISFTPDGKRVVVAGGTQVPVILDATTGEDVGGHFGHRGAVTCLRILEGGAKLVAGDSSGEILIWDIKEWKVLRSFASHAGPVNRLAISADGKRLASVGRDKFVSVRGLEDGSEVGRFAVPDFYAMVIAFWPDDSTIALNGDRKELQLYDAKSGELIRSMFGSRYLSDAAFFPDRKTVATSDGQRVRIWSLDSATPRLSLVSNQGMQGVALDPGGRWLVGSSSDLVIHDLKEGRTSTLTHPRYGPARPVFSSDGRFIAGFVYSKGFQVFEIASGEMVVDLPAKASWFSECAFLPDGRMLVSSSEDTTLSIWNLAPDPGPAGHDLEALWKRLGEGPIEARGAVEALIARGADAVSYIKERMRPKGDVTKLLADLDSADDKIRTEAFAAIESYGGEGESLIENAAAEEKDPERKERLRKAADSLLLPVVKSSSSLRRIRAMEVLERIGSEAALAELKSLATTAVSHRERAEAAAIVKRMEARK